MYDYIIGAVMLLALIGVLSKWRVGREIVISSLKHPFTTSVIHVSETPDHKKKQVYVELVRSTPEVSTAKGASKRNKEIDEEHHPNRHVAVG
jgi:hypothetical protein